MSLAKPFRNLLPRFNGNVCSSNTTKILRNSPMLFSFLSHNCNNRKCNDYNQYNWMSRYYSSNRGGTKENENDKETIFSKIIQKKLKANIVFEDNKCIAIEDINKQAPVHILIIPKKNIPQLSNAIDSDKELLGHLLLTGNQIAKQLQLNEKYNGFRLVINNGPSAGQTVFHLHIHLLSGREFSWPPG